MKTLEQKFMELREKANLGVKLCRSLLVLLLISISINIGLAFQLHKSNDMNNTVPTIISTGTMEKTGNNTFTIIPDEDLDSYQLPPIPETLK